MWRFGFLVLLLFSAIVAALTVGRYPLHLAEIREFVETFVGVGTLSSSRYELLRNIIVDIRLPRILAAVLVGSALASSGVGFQAIFRNPLVSPGILGVLGGAGFGAALGILYSGNWAIVQLCAFAMGLVAVAVSLAIANLFDRASIVILVLGGIISGSLFTSALSIVKYTADPYQQLPSIVYWLMGSLGAASLEQVCWAAVPVILGVTILSICGRALDALTMGDDEARSLGLSAQVIRYVVIVAATLISALSVSLVGMIGWIGLVIPHFARMLLGPRNIILVPASALLGAIFLVAADLLTRTLSSAEIPIGIVTELLGIPAFILVLRRARQAWV
jgi:iron complex transport system permease protein